MVVVSVVCIIPLSLLRSMESLSHVSTTAIIFYFCMVLKVEITLQRNTSIFFSNQMNLQNFSDCFRFRREDHIELLDRQYPLVATIWCLAMLADILYVIVMPNTDVRGIRIITESIAGKNESNCEGGHEHLHRSVHFGGCFWLRGIQWPRIFRQYFAQFCTFAGHRNH